MNTCKQCMKFSVISSVVWFFMSTFKSVTRLRKFECSYSNIPGGPELNFLFLEVRNGHLQRFHGEIHAKRTTKKNCVIRGKFKLSLLPNMTSSLAIDSSSRFFFRNNSELKQSLISYGDVSRNHLKFYTFIIINNYLLLLLRTSTKQKESATTTANNITLN